MSHDAWDEAAGCLGWLFIPLAILLDNKEMQRRKLAEQAATRHRREQGQKRLAVVADRIATACQRIQGAMESRGVECFWSSMRYHIFFSRTFGFVVTMQVCIEDGASVGGSVERVCIYNAGNTPQVGRQLWQLQSRQLQDLFLNLEHIAANPDRYVIQK